MDWLLPVFLIAGVPRDRRARLVEQLLPIALPGPASQRLAIATISAEQQLKRQALDEQRIVEEAINAAEFDDAADLTPFPALEAAFRRLPAAVQAVLFPASQQGPEDGEAEDRTLRSKKKKA